MAKQEINEKEVQKLYMEFQYWGQQSEYLAKQIAMIEEQAAHAVITVEALEDFRKAEHGAEILLPVANGIFAKGSLMDNEKLLVNVGSNIVVEKNVEQAKELISVQVSELRGAQLQLEQKRAEIEGRMMELEKKISSM